ncbi:MAG TPA: sodium/proton-translocating pyrophosphatase, partial [Bacteroidales bacterium]|nr:sodium/proton-translocating pyrophosphatase [Bacteroidales bacterium]
MPIFFWIVPLSAVVALLFAYIFYKQMLGYDQGNDLIKQIAGHIRKGALAYLKQQYKVVLIVFLCLTLLLSIMAFGLGIQNQWVPVAFLSGGFFSALAGFFGMSAATFASSRVANACRTSLNRGLKLAFRSGAVMGLVVVGLVLLDVSMWFIILNIFIPETEPGFKLLTITATMLTFGMGASTQALFARVGGGIYTKAADVGADLVGKVEAGIPEDDYRNPATIADNVGDNVGDVAGMGADLFESFAGSILATALLGAAAFNGYSEYVQFKAVITPMIIAAIGTLLSIVGVYMVRTREGASLKELLKSLS